MKVCGRCSTGKPIADFPRAKSTGERRRSYCRDCAAVQMREWRNENKDTYLRTRYKRQYNISDEQYENLKNITCCQICNKKKPLHLDHDHSTGEYRGMLCVNCNTALGGFKDDVKLLNKAIEYLTIKF